VWRSQLKQKASTQPTPQYRSPAENPFIQNAVRQFLMRGNKRLQNGDYTGAARAFQNALRLEPNNRMAQAGLEKAQAGMGSSQ
jgi:cytochrome c-type biogenesis protein CcmH/NrfG